MQTIKKIIITITAIIPIAVAAEAQYRLSAPIPGLEKVEGVTPFFSYLEGLIPFLLGATAVLAMVVITIGGVQYVISGGNESRRSDAKSRIWHAIGGLALAAISWLILNTINPDLVKLKLPLTQVTVGGLGSTQKIPDIPSCREFNKCLAETGTNAKNPDQSCLTHKFLCNMTLVKNNYCKGNGPLEKSKPAMVRECTGTAICKPQLFCGVASWWVAGSLRNKHLCWEWDEIKGNDDEKYQNIICP